MHYNQIYIKVFMTQEEKNIVENIASKLEFILYKDKITIRTLSKLLSIDNQPLYRIIKREHIPNLTFLQAIAKYLKCSILDLMDNKYCLDIKVYNNIIYTNKNKYEKYRAYVFDEDYKVIADNDFFGVINNSFIKIYYKTNKIITAGIYLLEINNSLQEINIIGVGTNLVFALINDNETKLNTSELLINARLYKTVSTIQSNEYATKII